MDRRMMAGLVGLALVGSSPTSWGMQRKDPSAVGTVGYTPLDSVTDRINNSALPGQAIPSSEAPTDPTVGGPAARIPTPPVGPNPVGLTPQPALDEAIEQGYPTSGFGFFRRKSAAAAAARTRAPRPGPAAKADPAMVPSRLTWDDSGQVPTSPVVGDASAGVGTPPVGRPAPYAGQAPDLARRQALPPVGYDFDGTTVVGRPAPLHAEAPRQGRPRFGPGLNAAAKPRPQSPATTNPRAPLGIGPAPAIPPTLPGPEPTEPAALPPLGPRAEGGDRPAEPAPLVAVATPDPLPDAPEPPPTLPAEPALAAADAPAGGLLSGLPDPPANLPSLSSEPMVSRAAVAPATPAAPGPDLEATVPTISLAAAPEPTRDGGPVDPAVQRTSADPVALRIDAPREKPRLYASARAAAVGDEVITVHQVQMMVQEKYKTMTAGQQVSDGDKRELINMLGTMALDHLIEQSLVLQAAKHRMKNPKSKQAFDEFVTKKWHDDRLPPLLRKYNAANEYELRQRLDEAGGLSYAEMLDTYSRDMLEHDFLYSEIRNKLNIDLIELRKYYTENIHQYDAPARINWREIEVSASKYPDRAAARKQAEALRARLARKEDFAAVAQASSDGPTASKGGLYAEMTPGSYGIPAVNEVLETIPEGQVSPVIETPTSFTIVLVESRRAAGPLRFDEVQKKVGEAVFERNMTRARAEYIAKLKTKTLVRVMPIFKKLGPDGRPLPDADADASVVPAANR